MKWGSIATAGAAMLLVAMDAAHAQTVSLTCTIGSRHLTTLSADGVMREPRTGPDALELVFDFDARTFVLGTTNGLMTADAETAVAMARQDPYRGIWEVNRRTGQLYAAGFLAFEEGDMFYTMTGQCRTQSGGTSF